jgi:dynein heavy chain
MVYVDSEELRWLPYVTTFMEENGKRLKEETKEYILELFKRYIDNGLKFIAKKCTQAMQQVILIFFERLLGA